MPKILVTGGAGFLGGHLVAFLLNKGHEVVVMDNFWTGTPETLKRIRDQSKLTLIKHDVTKPFPADLECDQIYHLACPASPTRFAENPLGILNTCFEGTRQVLELAARCKARVLLASTSEVYGDPLVCPQPESYWGNVNPCGPRSCYDEGKRVSEALAYAFRLQFGVDIRIVRIFNVYGPGLLPNDGRVVSNFITAAIAGRPIEITGDGKASRCFQFASDVVSGMFALMGSSYEGPVNIGCDRETSVGELAEIIRNLVAKKTGRAPVPVRLTDKREDDPFRRQPDISVAKKVLGWEPKVDLMEGLDISVDWYLSISKPSAQPLEEKNVSKASIEVN